MKDVLNKMIEQLSDEDKLLFGQLANKLNQVDGDLSKLSAEEYQLIAKMEDKYSDKLQAFSPELAAQTPVQDVPLLDTGFASYCRQILARDLKERFPKEEDAVKFAFMNKWIPQDFQENAVAKKIFTDFERDICDANKWRDELVGVESDKRMAVGMTWYMVIYQLNERLN
jgi:hypothetical protein